MLKAGQGNQISRVGIRNLNRCQAASDINSAGLGGDSHYTPLARFLLNWARQAEDKVQGRSLIEKRTQKSLSKFGQ